jgi:hypothetical protein
MPDDISKEIEDLIKQTGDPKDRAMLLLLNRLSVAVELNVSETRKLTKRFETHVEREDSDRQNILAILADNQNDGKWIGRIAGVLQVVIMAVVGWHLSTHDSLDGRVSDLEQYRAGHVQHHNVEERRRVRQLTDNLDG